MEVIKVIVKGELPKGCINCNLLSAISPTCCQAILENGQFKLIEDINTRPPWCPLVSTDDLPTDKDGWEWYMMSLIVQGKEK